MNARMLRRTLPAGVLLVLLLVISYQLVWGKLFPYSPVRPGFTRHDLARAVVSVEEGSPFARFAEIDSLIVGVEQAHGLTFTARPHILIFADSSSYLRRSTTRARFCAYPNGSLVVSPWAVREAHEGTISMEIYLSHELSHTLLYQHMDAVNAYCCFPSWFMEGVAVYNARQMGTSWYPSREETYRLIRKGNFVPPDWFGTSREDGLQLTVPYRSTFAYSEFACLVDHLIERHGKEKFVQYMTGLLGTYRHDALFQDVYGMEFEAFIEEFKAHVNH